MLIVSMIGLILRRMIQS